MNYPSGIMPNERPIYDQAIKEAAQTTCPRHSKHQNAVKPVFTWHPCKPYYLQCALCEELRKAQTEV